MGCVVKTENSFIRRQWRVLPSQWIAPVIRPLDTTPFTQVRMSKARPVCRWVFALLPFWFAALGSPLWTCTRWTWGWRQKEWLRCQHRPACWLHSQTRPRWLFQTARPHPVWGHNTHLMSRQQVNTDEIVPTKQSVRFWLMLIREVGKL